jgi:hypothetical protein
MNEQKPLYCFRGEDFIPIVGIKKHINRNTSKVLEEGENSNYFVQTFGREMLLDLYNTAIFIGACIGTYKGLIALLHK